MTTNQTINGVSRKLLSSLLAWLERANERNDDGDIAEYVELRALLDAPACKMCGDSGWVPEPFSIRENALECPKCKPAAKPQGEPVSIYQAEFLGEGGGGWSDVEHAEYLSLRSSPEFRLRIVYAAQPAPVAVVLLDQLANGSHLDDVPNHDDDSLSEIAHRCTCGQRNSLLKHAGRVDAEVARINPGAKP